MNALAKCGKVFSIGKSGLGRKLWAVLFGNAPKVILFGAIHAREWITASLLVELAKCFSSELNGKTVTNEKGERICCTDIAFVPMLNPDGVELCGRGLYSVPKALRQNLFRLNCEKEDFSLWKANARGVDLNVNFDACWGKGAQNVLSPASENYIGAHPFSERETYAIANFAKKSLVAIAYHTKGEVIYYGFEGQNQDKAWAHKFGEELGYEVETSEGSAGGFKDWFVAQKLGMGLTFECGNDNLEHPIAESELEGLVQQHRNIPKLAIEAAYDYQRKIHEKSDRTCARGRDL